MRFIQMPRGKTKHGNTGRHSTYDPKKVDAVLAQYANGGSIKGACKDNGLKYQTFLDAVYDDKDGTLTDRYSRAQAANARSRVDEIFEIADDASEDFEVKSKRDGSEFVAFVGQNVSRSDLRCRVRMWYAERAMNGSLDWKKRAGIDENGTSASERAIEALERIAAEKQASAKPAHVSKAA